AMLFQEGDSLGQTVTPMPAPDENAPTAYEVIVTGSNIPTAEEVGPNPVDIYRRVDLERLGVRSMTDFSQLLPAAAGAAINDKRVKGRDGPPGNKLPRRFPKE